MTTSARHPADAGLALLTGGSAGQLMAAVLSAAGGRVAAQAAEQYPDQKMRATFKAAVWDSIGTEYARLIDEVSTVAAQ